MVEKERVLQNPHKILKTWSPQGCRITKATLGPKVWPNDVGKRIEMTQTWQ